MPRTAFIAYPANARLVQASINAAVDSAQGSDLSLRPWEALTIQGLKLDALIRNQIDDVDFLVADITYPNFNVYYEIGYCIGRGKPVIPTVNSAVTNSTSNANLTGVFDTTGQARYENGLELFEFLRIAKFESWANSYRKPIDHSKPMFFLDMFSGIDFRINIVAAMVNAGIEYRWFDPKEFPRMTLSTIIGDVTSSVGLIIPLLSEEVNDNLRHNLRAAFVAGLAHGFGLEPLIIQQDNLPAPVDFRDNIKTARSKRELDNDVEEYCQKVLINNQRAGRLQPNVMRSALEKINIGSSAAEKEEIQLSEYFVRTAEYARAVRAEAGLVVGRKGSGKSAIFIQVALAKSRNPNTLFLELNPASHNLSEMREAILSVASAGIFDHTIAAFWQYILYMEILLRARQLALPKAKYNVPLLQKIEAIEKRFDLDESAVSADFTGRLESAVRRVVQSLDHVPAKRDVRQHITNILFESQLPGLREAVLDLTAEFDDILILFDNLDKGWPARGVEEPDLRMVRHLIEMLSRMKRDLQRKSKSLSYLLFLRSDVYEELTRETPDRQKYNAIVVDWSDPSQLKHLLKERVESVEQEPGVSAWDLVNPIMEDGSMAVDRMIEGSLMRPRFLIDLAEKAVSSAINRGHTSVQTEDVEQALASHSLYLVSEFGYEIRDVSGVSEAIFYSFIGRSDTLTQDEVIDIVSESAGRRTPLEVVDLLMWFGFLGIPDRQGAPTFIYDREYDMRRLMAERDRQAPDILYVVNPAFIRGLSL